MLQEKEIKALPGWPMVALLLLIVPALTVLTMIWSVNAESGYGIAAAIVVFVIDMVCLGGFAVINPNEAKVVQLFGVYKGTIKQPGFWWVNPFTRRRRVSLRVRNFESSKLKVNASAEAEGRDPEPRGVGGDEHGHGDVCQRAAGWEIARDGRADA